MGGEGFTCVTWRLGKGGFLSVSLSTSIDIK